MRALANACFQVAARLEAEREDWRKERSELLSELASQREQMLAHQHEGRQRQLETRKLTAEVSEARAEVSRLKEERASLVEQLKGGSSADSEDALALTRSRDLEGRLAESEKHQAEVSRKMQKAHKRQENLLAQFETEIEMLSDKVDQLEDECCEVEQARIKAESMLSEEEQRSKQLRLEVDRHVAREVIQPAGTQELLDQLEMANDVKVTLINDIALRTEELAALKVEYAIAQAEKEELAQRLRRSDQKGRMLGLRMTKLEVQLADIDNAHALQEEEKAFVFKSALESQEARIRELEALHVADTKRGKRWPF